MEKKAILAILFQELATKEEFLKSELISLTKSLENSAKSSAGDKHETDTAMNQLEQERLHKQLSALKLQQQTLKQINPQGNHTRCSLGSYIKTTQGIFFISVGLGKINHYEGEFTCIHLQSPVGQQLNGKSAGEHFQFGNKQSEILAIY